VFPVVQELAADGVPVAVTCRVLNVSTSGYYEWRTRPASGRAWEQAHLMETIRQVHAASYGTYGHRRVYAELVLGKGIEVSHGRVERLMRHTGLQGVHRRRLRGCTRTDDAATPVDDLVERKVHPGCPGPALRRRRHSAPHQRRLAVLRCGHRLLQPPCGGLVDR
jgi:hypothetical protein